MQTVALLLFLPAIIAAISASKGRVRLAAWFLVLTGSIMLIGAGLLIVRIIANDGTAPPDYNPWLLIALVPDGALLTLAGGIMLGVLALRQRRPV